MRSLLLFLLLSFAQIIIAQNNTPLISNLIASIDQTTQTITIDYDLFDSEDDEMEISLLVSDNGGISYNLDTNNATGDIGSSIFPSQGKSIIWNAQGLLTGSGVYKVKLIADDKQAIDIQEIVDQVDESRLLSNLQFIEGVRHRFANNVHLEAIKDSLEKRFTETGLETSRSAVPFNNYTGENIIGRLEGSHESENTYIIDGHFDTVDESPGADDNGSAVAGMLEVLRVLSPYSFQKSLRFIGFDLEEEGLIGALNYADNDIPLGENTLGVFNMEMIGYYTDEPNTQTFPFGFELLYPEVQADLQADQFRGNFITNICDQNSIPLQTAFNDAAAQYVPDLKVVSLAAPEQWLTLTPDFGRSDHAAFWLKDIPALMLTDGSNFRNPNYHTANDLISTLDFDFMTNVVKGVVATVAEEAGIQHSTQATAEFNLVSSSYNTLDCSIKVAPIPANDHIQISVDDCQRNLKIHLFDNMGRVVLDADVTISSSLQLNVNELNTGVYFLRLSDGGKQYIQKVVIL